MTVVSGDPEKTRQERQRNKTQTRARTGSEGLTMGLVAAGGVWKDKKGKTLEMGIARDLEKDQREMDRAGDEGEKERQGKTGRVGLLDVPKGP